MSANPERLKKQVQELSSLPTLSGVLKFVSNMTEQDRTTAQELGAVIAKDQVLSARILRLVNSPFYGFPGRISSVSHAIVLLGMNVVKGLALSTSVFDILAREAHGLWEHSLGTAAVSRRMARELNMAEAEEVMVAGLLHDLGKVVLWHLASDDYRKAMQIAAERRVHVRTGEIEVFGADHCAVGAWVAQKWHLPARLAETMTFHHEPMRAPTNAQTACIVHVSDILARGMGYGDGGDPTVPTLDADAFRSLGLSYHRIDQILVDAELEYNSGTEVFRGGNKA